jgi:hypothetical protein
MAVASVEGVVTRSPIPDDRQSQAHARRVAFGPEQSMVNG